MFEEIYKQIEAEVIKIAYQISIDENQKNVYSLNIGELQLRIFTQLEAVLKSKYEKDPTIINKKQGIKYDECIKPLNISDKAAVVVWGNYNLNKKLYNDVFKKIVPRLAQDGSTPTSSRQNYKFNNAYQNLRHSFEDSLKVYGTIEYLFEALAALFILLDYNNSVIFSKCTVDPNNPKKVSVWKSNGHGMSVRTTIQL